MTKAADTIRRILGADTTIDAALVLGSGLSVLGDALADKRAIPYTELEGFPGRGVSRHGRQLLVGTLGGKRPAPLAGPAPAQQLAAMAGDAAAGEAFKLGVG